jgi:hypothetical protein
MDGLQGGPAALSGTRPGPSTGPQADLRLLFPHLIGGKRLDNPALGHGPVAVTRGTDGTQLRSEAIEVRNFLLDRFQVPLSYQANIRTGLSVFRGQPQKIADLIERKSQIPAAANEPKAFCVLSAIGAVIALCPFWRRQDSNLLVVPDCDDLDARFLRQFPDAHVFAHTQLTL